MNILHHLSVRPSVCFTGKLSTLGLQFAQEAGCSWPVALDTQLVAIQVEPFLGGGGLPCSLLPPECGYFSQRVGVCRCVPRWRLQRALPVIRQRQPLHWRLRNGNSSVVALRSLSSIWKRQCSRYGDFSFLLFPLWIPPALWSLSRNGRENSRHSHLHLPSLPAFPPQTEKHTLTHTRAPTPCQHRLHHQSGTRVEVEGWVGGGGESASSVWGRVCLPRSGCRRPGASSEYLSSAPKPTRAEGAYSARQSNLGVMPGLSFRLLDNASALYTPRSSLDFSFYSSQPVEKGIEGCRKEMDCFPWALFVKLASDLFSLSPAKRQTASCMTAPNN